MTVPEHTDNFPTNPIKLKSLGKALSLFDCFIDHPVLSVTELSKKLGLNKSNVSDILSTFREMGYLIQDEGNGKYRLGLKMLRFSQSLYTAIDVKRAVFPHMQALANELGEILYFGVPNGTQVIYMEGAFPSQSIGNFRSRSMIGITAPLYCTGIGKAMLSLMPEVQWQDHLPEELAAYTENTIVDRVTLYENLRQARSCGYSIDDMEHEYGIKCVGVPLVNRYGGLVAGLSVSGPSLRFDADRIAIIAEKAITVARLLVEYL